MKGRIVIYRLGSIGDTVVALPCFHRIAEAFPDSERIVLTNFPSTAKETPLGSILRNSGLIHDVIQYPLAARKYRELWFLRRKLHSLHADAMVYLAPARGLVVCWRDWLFFRLCGFRKIIGLPFTPNLQSNRIDENGTMERECARLVRCLSAIGPIDLTDRKNWDLHLTAGELVAGQSIIKPLKPHPYLSINMGGKIAENDWGEVNWKMLLARLGKILPHYGLLIVGGKEDTARADTAASQWPWAAVNACGLLSPRESGAAMMNSRLFVGHDSGPLHLAASVGVPCVGLFGDNNKPKKWHPVGREHRILHNMQGLSSITIDEVVNAVCQISENKAAC
jgi:heptosyltransferase-3